MEEKVAGYYSLGVSDHCKAHLLYSDSGTGIGLGLSSDRPLNLNPILLAPDRDKPKNTSELRDVFCGGDLSLKQKPTISARLAD